MGKVLRMGNMVQRRAAPDMRPLPDHLSAMGLISDERRERVFQIAQKLTGHRVIVRARGRRV